MSVLKGRKVKTVDDSLKVFSDRDVNSASRGLGVGFEIQLGAISEFEGRQWVEVILPEEPTKFALSASVRSHTDVPADVSVRSFSGAPVSNRIDIPAGVPAWPSRMRYRWGIFLGLFCAVFAALIIGSEGAWLILRNWPKLGGDAFHPVLGPVGDVGILLVAMGPWPLALVLGAIWGVAGIGILRRVRFGVIAWWVAAVGTLVQSLSRVLTVGIDPGSMMQLLPALVMLFVNGVYFGRRWRFMNSELYVAVPSSDITANRRSRSKDVLAVFGIGILCVLFAWAGVVRMQRTLYELNPGQVLRVRTTAITADKSVAIIDFRLSNTLDEPAVVQSIKVSTQEESESRFGNILDDQGAKRVFDTIPAMGPKYNASLIPTDKLPGRATWDRMIGATFDCPVEKLQVRKSFTIYIEKPDGSLVSLTENRGAGH